GGGRTTTPAAPGRLGGLFGLRLRLILGLEHDFGGLLGLYVLRRRLDLVNRGLGGGRVRVRGPSRRLRLRLGIGLRARGLGRGRGRRRLLGLLSAPTFGLLFLLF